MMTYISTLLRAAAASLIIGTAASAAPIDFIVDTTPGTGSGVLASCSSAFGGPDSTCNFSITVLDQPAPIVVQQGGSNTFSFLQFNAAGFDPIADNAVINASLKFLSPALTFGSTGTGSNITTALVPISLFPFSAAAFFTSTSLIWSTPVSQFFPGVGTVSVALSDTVFGLDGSRRSFLVNATISIEPIPLPAGVLLLGTALLGLFGLSRRRKQAAA